MTEESSDVGNSWGKSRGRTCSARAGWKVITQMVQNVSRGVHTKPGGLA